MDAHDRFERRSLRDVLVDDDVLSEELADELMNSARRTHEPFGSVVVQSGNITAWDLACTVSVHYNMPFLPLGGFAYDKSLWEGIPSSTLYQYQVLPVGRFGDSWSFAVVEPPTRDCIAALTENCGSSLFFFVAEYQEILRLLNEHITVVDTKKDSSWQSIFDDAEERVGQ
jgi:hypothetical protein